MRNSVSVILRGPLPLLGFILVSEAFGAFRKGKQSLGLSFLGMSLSTAPFWRCPDAVGASPVPFVLMPQRRPRASFLQTTGSHTGIQPRALESLVTFTSGPHQASIPGGNPRPQSCGHTMPGRHHFLSVLTQSHAPQLPSEGAPTPRTPI